MAITRIISEEGRSEGLYLFISNIITLGWGATSNSLYSVYTQGWDVLVSLMILVGCFLLGILHELELSATMHPIYLTVVLPAQGKGIILRFLFALFFTVQSAFSILPICTWLATHIYFIIIRILFRNKLLGCLKFHFTITHISKK